MINLDNDARVLPPATVEPSPPAPATDYPVGHRTVIRPTRGWVQINFREIWAYRELLLFLTWRDIKVRYKQTALGAAWAILQPTLTMLVFSIFFGRLAKVPSDGIPYPIFALSGLIPWQLFSYALTQSSNSVVANKNLVTKVYFPRLIVPLAAVLSGLVDFAIAFAVLLVMMLYYGIRPGAAIAAIPIAIFFTVLAALAVGLWLSALNVRYRDVQYTIPFLTQFWMFVTPIAYSSTLVPERYHILYGLNPMAGVVESFRWALLGHARAPGPLMVVSAVVVVVAFFGGLAYFRRVEKTFADLA
jgi:lipopolysaccharide transport system permease protein